MSGISLHFWPFIVRYGFSKFQRNQIVCHQEVKTLVHMFLWRINPFSFKLDAAVEAIDLTVKKVVSYRDTDCNGSDDYDYIGR